MNTTVVAVVAPETGNRTGPDRPPSPLDGVRAANVRVVQPDADGPPLDRAQAAWDEARRCGTPYLLHDADPLAWVADAWARRFDAQDTAGDLEVAVAETLARWRARTIDLPDYYLVVEPEDLRPTLRHWYLGVLASAAPARVVTGRPGAPVVDQLAALRPGPWWPGLDRIVAELDRLVPDQAGLPTQSRGGSEPEPGVLAAGSATAAGPTTVAAGPTTVAAGPRRRNRP